MKSYLASAFAAALLMAGIPASAQVAATAQNVPDLPYEAVPGFFHGIPAGDYLGEMQGVATNSKGHIFAFFRGPNRGCGSSTRRQIRPGNRQGFLRLHVRPFGARGPARQYLDGGRGHQHGHQVRSHRQQGADGDRPSSRCRAGSHRLAAAAPTRRPRNTPCAVPPTSPGTCRTNFHLRRLLQQPRRQV